MDAKIQHMLIESQRMLFAGQQRKLYVDGMGIGHKIRALRESRTWTQALLGELAGVEQATISAIEKRDSTRSEYIAPLAGALGVPLDELIALPADVLVSRYGTHAADRQSPKAPEPLTLYSAPGEMQSRLLSLFDELTAPQQHAVLDELKSTVEANRAILQHYEGRRMRHTENERVEATFGVPKRKKT